MKGGETYLGCLCFFPLSLTLRSYFTGCGRSSLFRAHSEIEIVLADTNEKKVQAEPGCTSLSAHVHSGALSRATRRCDVSLLVAARS